METKSPDSMSDTEMILTAGDNAANPKWDAYIIYEH